MSDHISETPYYALLRPAALLAAAGALAFAAFVLVSQGGAQRGAPSVQQPFATALAAAKLQQHTELLRREGYVDAEDLVDADDADLAAAGLKLPEIKRLRRVLARA
jgi:hypothetical protein